MTQPRATGSSTPGSTHDRGTTFRGNTAEPARGSAGEKAGLFERYSWLVPVTAVAAVFVAFLLMVVITALAGGEASFGG